MFKMKKYSDVLRRMIFVSIIPFILLIVTTRILSNSYLRNIFITENSKVIENQVANFDEQVKQLEVAIDYLIYNIDNFNRPPLGYNYQTKPQLDNVTNQLFLFENSNALVQSVELIKKSSQKEDYSMIIQSSGNRRVNLKDRKMSYLNQITDKGWYKIDGAIKYVKYTEEPSSNYDYAIITLDNQMVRNLLSNRYGMNAISFLFINDELVLTDSQKKIIEKSDEFKTLSSEKDKYININFDMNFMNSKWNITSFYPIDLVLQPLRRTFNIITLLSVITILSLVIYEYGIYNKFKRYISEKMDKLFGEGANANEKNEFEIIATRWKLLNDSKEELEEKIEQNYERLASNVIYNVISGRTEKNSYQQINNELKMFGFDLEKGFQVLNVTFTEPFEGESQNIENFESILRKEFQINFPERLIIKSSPVSYLLFIDNAVDIGVNKTRIMKINEITKYYMTVVFGAEITNVENLYNEIQKVFAYRTYQRLIFQNQFIDINNFQPPNKHYNVNTDQNIENIITTIRTSDNVHVEKSFNDWFNMVIDNCDYQYYLLQEVRKLSEAIRKSFSEEQLISSADNNDDFFRKLMFIFDKKNIKEFVWSNVLVPIVEKYVDSNQAKIELAVIKLVEYVNANYMDRNLSLDERAEQLDVDIVHLSRYFKAKMGLNYIDYLTQVRLNKAKQLLVQTVFPIKEIADSVGYESSYFNRIFKKNYNMTPGEYRKRNQITKTNFD